MTFVVEETQFLARQLSIIPETSKDKYTTWMYKKSSCYYLIQPCPQSSFCKVFCGKLVKINIQGLS